jgi:hypothetical protein
MFSNHFNMLISKIIFLIKNIILIYFKIKNTLKNNRYHTFKHPLRIFLLVFHDNLIVFFSYNVIHFLLNFPISQNIDKMKNKFKKGNQLIHCVK